MATTSVAVAQSTSTIDLPRADVHGSIGWTNLRRSDLQPYDQWDHEVAHVALGAGWYWTDHLKTEIEVSADSRGDFYTVEPLRVGTQTAYWPRYLSAKTQALTIAQVFQAFRNAWVHPYVGIGADVRREVLDEWREAAIVYEPSRGPIEVAPATTLPRRTSTHLRPFVEVGVKAYVNERAFFRSDLRVDVANPATQRVIARAGFGFDF